MGLNAELSEQKRDPQSIASCGVRQQGKNSQIRM